MSQSPDRIATPIAPQPSGRQRRPSVRSAVARASPSSLRIAGTPTNTSAIVPTDPHGGGEQVDDTQDGEHARHCRRSPVTDAALASRHRRIHSLAAWILNDWILALHLLSAFAFVGRPRGLLDPDRRLARNIDTPGPTIALGTRSWRDRQRRVVVGALGTIVFGVWLAISRDAYQVWDGWVIAAIVLWAIGGGVGARAGEEYERALHRARELQASGETGPSNELPR